MYQLAYTDNIIKQCEQGKYVLQHKHIEISMYVFRSMVRTRMPRVALLSVHQQLEEPWPIITVNQHHAVQSPPVTPSLF